MKRVGLLPLALATICRHPGRSTLMVIATAVVLALPLLAEGLLSSWRSAMAERARSTPVVLGPRGGRFDLLLDALLLRPGPTPMTSGDLAAATAGLAVRAVPLHLGHQAGGRPLVGTDLDYFRFRHLGLAAGTLPQRLGDCLLGASVAHRLGLAPGDELASDPQGLLDPTAGTRARLRVTGVLAATGTVDDDRAFCDLKTSWVLDGIGHGHTATDAAVFGNERHEAGVDLALADSFERLDSFHFHGDPNGFPVSAAVVDAADTAELTLLRGRLVSGRLQALDSMTVLDEVVTVALRFQTFARYTLALAAAAAGLLLALVAALGLRLRAAEFTLLADLGWPRGRVRVLIVLEWLILLALAATLALALVVLGQAFAFEHLRSAIASWQS